MVISHSPFALHVLRYFSRKHLLIEKRRITLFLFILAFLKALFSEKCFMEVPQMALLEADLILNSWLKSVNRTLQPPQKEVILDAFQRCQLPLYLKLVFDGARRWESYTPCSDTRVEPTVTDIISAMFHRVERLHGKLLVSHALGYITASKNGLTNKNNGRETNKNNGRKRELCGLQSSWRRSSCARCSVWQRD